MMHRTGVKLICRFFRSHPLHLRTYIPGRQVIKGRFLYSTALKGGNYSTTLQDETAIRPKAAEILEKAFSEGRHIRSVQCVDDKEWVEIEWKDGLVTEYPYIWLRDNCQCETCFNKFSITRCLRMKDLDLDIKPKEIKIISDDMTLYKWICSVEELGVSVLTNAPCEVGQLKKIGDRIGHLRKTNYGETFHVMSKEGPSNLAYTSGELCFHTDLLDYDNIPGVQMLHCIKQSPCKGGGNQFADALNAAKILKDRHPDMYQRLTTTLIDFYDVGTEEYMFYTCGRHPFIELDIEGNLKKVVFNNHTRNSFCQVPLDKVIKLYRAMKTYNSILYEEDNHILYKPKPGDIITFDNTRVVHGRSAYQVTKGEERHLEGCYIDWDGISSRRRVLMMDLNII